MESATDVRLDGDEMAADADDGDAGHFSGTYMSPGGWITALGAPEGSRRTASREHSPSQPSS